MRQYHDLYPAHVVWLVLVVGFFLGANLMVLILL